MKKEERQFIKKVWGYEIILVNCEEYCGKLLLLNKGAISSLHCHHNKKETFYCLEGQAVLTIDGKTFDLNDMASAKTIFPNEYHQFEGLARTSLLEISTHHDDNDVERKEPSKAGRNSWKL
jgi:mannose-6-phosphate isomerase-like protein (cupin superfamily)